MPRALTLAVALAVAAPLAGAHAQTASETAAARRLFRQGLAAARGGEWAEAVASFERSYAIAPRPNTLLNLAGAQAQTGALVAATESYRRFLAEATGRRSRRLRARAAAELEELEGRLAHLTVTVDGLTESDSVRLDGEELSRALLGVDFPVDPGARVLLVRRGARDLVREELTLAEGERRDVSLDATPNLEVSVDARPGELPPSALEADPPGDDDTAVIVGVSIGVGVAVVAAAIITAVVLLEDGAQPHQGSFGEGSLTFD